MKGTRCRNALAVVVAVPALLLTTGVLLTTSTPDTERFAPTQVTGTTLPGH
jgi:hypothetical protein